MKIAILEDEPRAAKTLSGYIEKFFAARGENVNLRIYNDAFTLLEEYRSDVDVLFMDIQMNLMNGMEAAVRIRKQDPRVLIVFVTNLAQYAVEGYAVNAFDFILKPVNYTSFSMKLERILKELNHLSGGKFINVKTKTEGVVRLDVSDISYVEVKLHDLIFHTSEKIYVSRGALKSVCAELEKYYFSLCNNCYLVNLAYVRKANKTLVLSTGEELFISQGKRKQFMSELAKYMGDTI